MSDPEDILRAFGGGSLTRPHQFAGVFEATVTRVSLAGPKFTIAGMGQVEFGPARYLQALSLEAFGSPAVGSKILVAFLGGDPGRPVAVGRLSSRWPLRASSAQGAFALTFDDCWPQQRQVLDRMASYGQHATVFANKTELGHVFGYANPGMLDLEALARHQDQGHEIGNHTRDHLSVTALTPAVRASSLETVNADFAGAGIDVSSFAYPFGDRSLPTDRDVAAHGLRVFRYPGVSQFPRWDAAGVFRVGAIRLFSDSADPSGFGQGGCAIRDAKALARMAAASPIIVSFFCHLGPDYQYPAGVEPTISEVYGLLEYLAGLGLPCLTYREAFGGLNGLVNPSFEDNPANPDGWTVFYRFGDGTDSVEAITPYPGGGGTHGLRLEAPTSADGAQRGQRVWVKPGRSYMLSGRAQLTGATDPAVYAQDAFARTVTDAWGNAPTGGTWAVGTGPTADFDVAAGKGTILASAANANHYATLPIGETDVDVLFSFLYDHGPAAVNANFDVRAILRWQNISNYVYVVLQAGSDGLGAISLWKVVANAHTQIGGPITDAPDPVTSSKFWGRIQAIGDVVRVKFWADDPDEGEPDVWQAVFDDQVVPAAGGGAGLGVLVGGGITASTLFSFDDLAITEPQGAGGVAGLRLAAFQLDANGKAGGSVETARLDLEQGGWVQLAFDHPMVMDEDTVAVEVRASLNGLAGIGHADNVTWGLAASQPDGPVG